MAGLMIDRPGIQLAAEPPMRLTQHLIEDHVWHRRVRNYRAHPIRQFSFRYLDVD